MKKMIALLLTVFLLISSFGLMAFAENDEEATFTICGALGDNMVLQRGTKINVWGTSKNPGATVSITFKGKTTTATVQDDGTWLAELPEEEADSNENTLTAECNGEKIELNGILIGDVFFVGGQSNAEKSLEACGSLYNKEFKEQIMADNEDHVRYFQQSRSDIMGSTKGKARMTAPQTEPPRGKKWKKESLSVINGFSAMGVFFAHKMYAETKVPIGMVMVASSGSPVSQLMSAEAAALTGYDRFENDIPVSGMYNAIMHPFIQMKIKAMLYYQGESEQGLAVSDYGKYNVYMNAYVEDLRMKMKQDFPFYFVQLSSHGGDGLNSWKSIGEQRAVQFDGLKMIKNSGMIVCMDQGFYDDGQQTDFAHPNKKQPVGERLAALVLARDYKIGEEENVTSPFPTSAEKTADGVVIHFTHVAGGLKKLGNSAELKGFKAILQSGDYMDVAAEILSNGTDVLLKTNTLNNIKGVGYGLELLAFTDFDDKKYIANLGNGADLPAPTFKITEFAEDAPAETAAPDAPTSAAPGEKDTPAQNTDPTVWIIIGCSAAIVIAVVAVIVVLKKKKK